MNSIKLKNRMDIIFMNSKNSETSDPHRLLLNLTDKINLKRNDKYVTLSNLNIYYAWKNMKKSYKIINFKYQLPSGTKNLNYLMDPILYQIFKIILQKHKEKTNNPWIRIYVNNIENNTTFKIKRGYYLELLTLETMKLSGSSKSK